ncbi:hypothetical protein MRX96_044585 [Rhipicephalus microplus]
MCPPTTNFVSGFRHETPMIRRRGFKGGWLTKDNGKHVTLTHSILPFVVDLGEPAHFGDLSRSEPLIGATRCTHL